jgi:hypothetical protein
MKLKVLGLLALAAIVAGLAVPFMAQAVPDDAASSIKADNVVCKSIKASSIEADNVTIRSADGKTKLTLCRWENGVGIFTGSERSSQLVCIVQQGSDSPYIGLNSTTGGAVCPIAISLDNNNAAVIQVTESLVKEREGELREHRKARFITSRELLKIAK